MAAAWLSALTSALCSSCPRPARNAAPRSCARPAAAGVRAGDLRPAQLSLQQRACLVQLHGERGAVALHQAGRLAAERGVDQLLLDGLLSLVVCLFGVVQLESLLGLQRLQVLSANRKIVNKLLLLIRDLAVYFLLDLGELQLRGKYLVLLLLDRTLGLLQGGLQLLLLHLQSALLLVQLVDGTPSVAQQVLDLVSRQPCSGSPCTR